jgi:hypothetical protein
MARNTRTALTLPSQRNADCGGASRPLICRWTDHERVEGRLELLEQPTHAALLDVLDGLMDTLPGSGGRVALDVLTRSTLS